MEFKVSIIVPAYNVESCIERCVNSLRAQSYSNVEIICVDDGSTDKTNEKLLKIAELDNRIKIITKENGGVSSARNAGLEVATGKYIQFVDSDDLIEANMTERLVATIESNNAELVICGYHSIDNSIRCSQPTTLYTLNELQDNFFNIYTSTYLNPPWNKLYIREKINHRFNDSITLGEDLIFNLEYIKSINHISVINDELYVYSVGNLGSLTTKYHQNAFIFAQCVIESILMFLPKNVFEQQMKKISLSFAEDFKRCVVNLVTQSGYNKKKIMNELYTQVSSPFWREYVLNLYDGDDKILNLLKYKHLQIAIMNIKLENICVKIKIAIKSIVNKIFESGFDHRW